MNTVIFSDVHGNLQALEAMIEQTRGAEVYWCLGDTLGYGPEPMECLDRVFELCGDRVLLGKHDVVGILPDTVHQLPPTQQKMWAVQRKRVDPNDWRIAKLRKCKFGRLYGKAQMLRQFGNNTRPPASELVFVPQKGERHMEGSFEFRGMLGGMRSRVYAVGSIGMNPYQVNRTTWCEYDTTTQAVRLISTEYDAREYRKEVEWLYEPDQDVVDSILVRASDREKARNDAWNRTFAGCHEFAPAHHERSK
jgi:hypothetical protein